MAFADKNPLRRPLRPMLEPVADAACRRAQRRRRSQQDAAVATALRDNGGGRKQGFPMIAADGCECHAAFLFPACAHDWLAHSEYANARCDSGRTRSKPPTWNWATT